MGITEFEHQHATASDNPAGDAEAGELLRADQLLRLTTMSHSLLAEAREVELDRHGRQRMIDIYERSVQALREALPDELSRELDELLTPAPTGMPTGDELLILQAQLTGWLAGLLQGLHASAWAQHVAAQQQLEELRHARALESEQRAASGSYL